MYLKHSPSDDLVEILELGTLFDPFKSEVQGRFHAGEEMQEASRFAKAELVFPSGEVLPVCWTDGKYKEKSLR